MEQLHTGRPEDDQASHEDFLRRERELGTILEAYAGQWVCIDDQQLVASGGTLKELLENGAVGEVFQVIEGPFFGFHETA